MEGRQSTQTVRDRDTDRERTSDEEHKWMLEQYVKRTFKPNNVQQASRREGTSENVWTGPQQMKRSDTNRVEDFG